MATVVKTDGTTIEVTPKNKKSFTFKEIKQHLDFPSSYSLQLVPMQIDNILLVCDEDGRMHQLAPNKLATMKTQGQVLGSIVGNAFFCDMDEIQ